MLLAASAAVHADAPASDAEIVVMMKTRVDVDHAGTGMVVGIIDARGSHVLAYGTLSEGGAPVDGDSVYEIGSITKVFTATLLSDMARGGEIDPDAPAARYLPVKLPAVGERQITLADLSSQLSGIPSIPSNLQPKDDNNPFADYTVPQLYEFVSGFTPARPAGQTYEYSNAGVGLLGHILTLRAKADYETLVRQRITGPLGMNDTAITLTPAMRQHLAVGYGMPGMPAANWDMPVLAGMGALRSSTADMLKFVGANMGLGKPPLPLYGAMQATHRARHGLEGKPGQSIALGWHVLEQNGSRIVWHNGGTAGYRTYIGFDETTGRGVVLMSNSHMGSDDIARRALNGAFPIIVPKPMAM